MKKLMVLIAFFVVSCGSDNAKKGQSFDPDEEDGPKIAYLVGKTIVMSFDEEKKTMEVKVDSASAYSGTLPNGDPIAGSFVYSVDQFGSKLQMTQTSQDGGTGSMSLGWSDAASGICTYMFKASGEEIGEADSGLFVLE